jgi:GNAT superfamily N-acetyltransferase
LNIKKAELEDLNIIIDIFMNAIKVMNGNNINQWDEVYPTNTNLEQDVLNGQMYVGIKDCEIVSAIVINNECEEEYKSGNWRYDNDRFAVVHRLCVNPIHQNIKIGRDTMIKIEELLKTEGIQSIRLDAFSLNPHALKMYQTLGYQKVGEAKWRKGLFYLLTCITHYSYYCECMRLY